MASRVRCYACCCSVGSSVQTDLVRRPWEGEMLRACKCRWARAHAQRPTGKTSSSALSPQASPEGMPGRCNATYNPDEGVCVARDSLHPPTTFPIPLPLTQLTPPGPWFISEAIFWGPPALHQFALLHSSHCSECSPVRLPRAASPLVRILPAEAPTNPRHPLNHSQPNSTQPSNASPIPTQPLPKPHATPHPMQDKSTCTHPPLTPIPIHIRPSPNLPEIHTPTSHLHYSHLTP